MTAPEAHDMLKTAGGLAALALFAPMFAQARRDGGAGQSCATWLLWGTLDIILTASIVRQRGNFLLPLGFAIGDFLLVVLLVVEKRFSWGGFETIILALVSGSVVAWYFGGSRTATIAATLGICVAGIPGFIALWRDPRPKIGTLWLGYVAANLLSFFGGTAMTIGERFAPGVFAIYSFVMFLAGRRPPGPGRQASTESQPNV